MTTCPLVIHIFLSHFRRSVQTAVGKKKNNLLQAPTFLGSPYSTLSSPWEVGQFSKRMFPLINKTTPPHSWVEESLQRTSQALASLLLSLRLSPTIRLVGLNLQCVRAPLQVPGGLRASELACAEPALHDGSRGDSFRRRLLLHASLA